MKKKWSKLFVAFILIPLAFINCSKEVEPELQLVKKLNPDTLTINHAMKGWELYSWPDKKNWNYSLLEGTNRVKSLEEITDNPLVICGTDSLKMVLDKFPENESITWFGKGWFEKCWQNNYGNLTLADTQTINTIKNYCVQKNLQLSVTD